MELIVEKIAGGLVGARFAFNVMEVLLFDDLGLAVEHGPVESIDHLLVEREMRLEQPLGLLVGSQGFSQPAQEFALHPHIVQGNHHRRIRAQLLGRAAAALGAAVNAHTVLSGKSRRVLVLLCLLAPTALKSPLHLLRIRELFLKML